MEESRATHTLLDPPQFLNTREWECTYGLPRTAFLLAILFVWCGLRSPSPVRRGRFVHSSRGRSGPCSAAPRSHAHTGGTYEGAAPFCAVAQDRMNRMHFFVRLSRSGARRIT